MFLSVSGSCIKPAGISKAYLLMLLSLLTYPQAALASEVIDVAQAEGLPQADMAADAEQQHYNFPHWPRHQQTNRAIIPPPPPGPYMSSALSDYSVRAPSFGNDPHKYEAGGHPAYRENRASVPMDIFSPDIPWPKNLKPDRQHAPNRWMTENGYRYVKPQTGQNFSAAPPRSRPKSRDYNYGNYYAPQMKGMNFNGRPLPLVGSPGGSSMGPTMGPAMGMSPYGPYRNMPTYGRPQTNGGKMNSSKPFYPPR